MIVKIVFGILDINLWFANLKLFEVIAQTSLVMGNYIAGCLYFLGANGFDINIILA